MKWPESMATVRSAGSSSIKREGERARIDVRLRRWRRRTACDCHAPRRMRSASAGSRQPDGCAVQRPRVLPAMQRARLRTSPTTRNVDAMVRADRVRIVVDLDDRRTRMQQLAVACRPHVEPGTGAEHHVRLADQLGRGRRGETAEIPSAHGLLSEQSVGDRRGRQQTAQQLRQPAPAARRCACIRVRRGRR